VLISVVFIVGCSSTPTSNQLQSDTVLGIKNGSLEVTVETVTLLPKVFSQTITCIGKVESLEDAVIHTKTGGLVEASYVARQKKVTKGQLLIKFDTKQLRLRQEKLMLDKFNAEKEYESQLLGYEHSIHNLDDSQQLEVRKKLQISSGLSSLQLQLKEIDILLSESKVEAPFSGIIADGLVYPGQNVVQGSALFRIYNPARMVVAARILESDLPLLNSNIEVALKPLGWSNSIVGKLSDISPVVDESGQVTVRFTVLQPKFAVSLFVGMNVGCRIKVFEGDALVLPREAIVYRNNRSVVFTFENGKAKWNYVTLGKQNENEVEIQSGLPTRSEVIISNNLQLADGTQVRKLSSKTSKF
jgi:RND family efflux transporter MFP subunit